MTDTQMQRDNYGSLPFLSHWSRHEPASITKSLMGNTDHWSKMKHKTVDFSVLGKDGLSYAFKGDRARYEMGEQNKTFRYRHDIDGSMRNIGTRQFTDWIIKELDGNVPGDYTRSLPSPPKIWRTAANERAKDGFRYWYIEKKPSSYAKAWTGSKGNTLGLTG